MNKGRTRGAAKPVNKSSRNKTTHTPEEQRDDPRRSQMLAGISALSEEIKQIKTSITVLEASKSAQAEKTVVTLNSPHSGSSTSETSENITSPNIIYQSTALIVPTDDRTIKLYNLPNFHGKHEDWPLFLTNFNYTTKEFGYNNRQNLTRLQKALQGDAKKTVESLLIFPDDV